ncbi:MAG: hypothetical protein OXH31_09720 [Gammaproteobacteria bacterium]|nr:hypothetical protein [Gammaproteobacteria bacterium]
MKIFYDEHHEQLQPAVIVLEDPDERELLNKWVKSLKKQYEAKIAREYTYPANTPMTSADASV